jgi:general secretion pathway protein D
VLNAGQFSGLQGPVRIVADDMNNALIVQGSAADYAYLLETIKRMDILPRQVIIDARIFEIDLSDSYSFGVSAVLQGRTPGQHLKTAQIAAETGALSASTFAFIGSAREILMNLDALRLKTKVRILEAPSVLAIDGMQAHIQVGGSVPVPGMSYVAPAGGATTGVNYTETGTVLDIVPRISASGTVTLSIAQNVISPGAQTSLGPTFSQTSVSTTLAVKDGESVAIAGLIRESDTNARSGVPFLSDIPILGALFGRTTKSAARTELLIMITPHVIRTPDRFREMTEELKDSLRNAGKYVDEKQKQMQDDKDTNLNLSIEKGIFFMTLRPCAVTIINVSLYGNRFLTSSP